ncbi:unnamed protein product [Linum tenue]|uniref:Uncharacterized protein n=1 Tax=Linum tenue TaxID=586396 RepID=A0AAV0HIT2_9ROSI|nr:unnamed protein product [Linum tenue]
MTITLKDVAMLTELPIDGDAIIESSQKPLNGWGQFISERLGINIPEEAEEGRRVPPLHKSMLLIPWLVRTVGELPEDATDAQIERREVRIVVVSIERMLWHHRVVRCGGLKFPLVNFQIFTI